MVGGDGGRRGTSTSNGRRYYIRAVGGCNTWGGTENTDTLNHCMQFMAVLYRLMVVYDKGELILNTRVVEVLGIMA